MDLSQDRIEFEWRSLDRVTSPKECQAVLTLYYAPGTCALASHIALIDAGAAYTTLRLDFEASEQRSAEYLAINPKGRVPSLVTKHGVLTETPAILAYLAQIHPHAGLMPRSPFEFAVAQAFNSYLCSTVHVAHAHRMRGHRWVEDPEAIEAMKRKVPQAVFESFDLIERSMLRGPWVMGTSYSICDAYLYTIARWLEGDGVDPAKLPRIQEHRDRMAARRNVQQALREQAVLSVPNRATAAGGAR